MVSLCQEGMDAAANAFREGDATAAEPAFQNERRINQLEIEIDHAVADCFARFQPVAVDLRFLLAILKINNDLERIGDHVVNIAQSVVTCASRPSFAGCPSGIAAHAGSDFAPCFPTPAAVFSPRIWKPPAPFSKPTTWWTG